MPSRIVVGLGNPGEGYAATRHNLGFRVVEELARRRRLALDREDCRCRFGVDGALGLAAPQTFMNRSGYAVRCLAERFELGPEAFLVVYDELHLPLGRLRLRPSGSPAGHHGIESVLESLGTDGVARLRLGIAPEGGAPPGDAVVGFVLSPFAPEELETVEAMVARAADACEAWAVDGTEPAMQRFNG